MTQTRTRTRTYSRTDFTYGAELEYADWHVHSPLPQGCKWDQKDHSIVNSNGIGNDPKGIFYQYGGEINTRPTQTVIEQVELFEQINQSITPPPVINYRCNLHIHIGVPGLSEDLNACKALLRYIDANQEAAFAFVEPIPEPLKQNYTQAEAYRGARKRYNRRKVSHQYKLPPARVEACLAATTLEQFYHSHARSLDGHGNPAFFQIPRSGINLRQLFEESGTVEFRHFPGTLDPVEFKAALDWCAAFMEAALITGKPAEAIAAEFKGRFPRFKPYQHELEKMYAATTPAHNSRKKLETRFKKLRERGIIA